MDKQKSTRKRQRMKQNHITKTHNKINYQNKQMTIKHNHSMKTYHNKQISPNTHNEIQQETSQQETQKEIQQKIQLEIPEPKGMPPYAKKVL